VVQVARPIMEWFSGTTLPHWNASADCRGDPWNRANGTIFLGNRRAVLLTLLVYYSGTEVAATPYRPTMPVAPIYWRVEGSLLELTAIRPIAFFSWNSRTFGSRLVRRSLVLLMVLLRPFLYAANRVAATRIVHAVLRGITRDRLDLLGEEEFEYKLKPLLKKEGVRHLKALQATGVDVVLVGQGLEHVMRPLA
jgi:hypothetical protein